MDKNIPLSEAIRIGSKVTKQCYGSYFDREGAACALGAAAIALAGPEFATPGKEAGLFLQQRYPKAKSYLSQIARMNDNHQTCEEIADWLESIGL